MKALVLYHDWSNRRCMHGAEVAGNETYREVASIELDDEMSSEAAVQHVFGIYNTFGARHRKDIIRSMSCGDKIELIREDNKEVWFCKPLAWERIQ